MASRPRIGPPFLVHPIQRARAVSQHTNFNLKNSYHQISAASKSKGIGTDLNLLTNHK
jgi:hypothetical protein